MTSDLRLIHTQGLDEGIRCAMCTNTMKSDKGCDGGCVVDQKMYEKVLKVIDKALEAQRWIPKNATNGDMIISLYPNLKYYVKGDRMMTTIGVASSFDLEWWNAPYREGNAE